MEDRIRMNGRKSGLLVVLSIAVLLSAGIIPAQTASRQTKTLEAVQISEPITVDGVLDEAAWSRAVVGTDFTQREPDTGKPASQRTEIRVIYTPRTLYIGVMCYDTEPNKIINKEMQRDQALWRDDSIDIVLDTFNDDRNAYLFESNPNGAQTDALITDEGRDFNIEWDGVWDVQARITDSGWSAEVAIPFSTLRFDPEAESWGFNVRRYIRRTAEETYWSPVGLDGGLQRISVHGALTGIHDVEQGWNLNVKPFVVGEAWKNYDTTEEEAEDEDYDFGLDVKWGIGRGLNLDLTLNTDFGETEVDELQVNLTRFPLFFPEKREFFLENAGIFEFGPGATGGGTPLLKVFHSRRIGISDGAEVPIEWGARLTGRVGEWSLGILDVQTDTATLSDDSEVPRNNWGAVRVSRNFGERSSAGVMFTNRNDEGNTNRVYGFDMDYQPSLNLGFDAYYAASDNSETGSEAGTDTDWTAGLGTTWDGSTVDWRLGWVRVGDDFDPQMGFYSRRGVSRYNTAMTWEPRPAISGIMNFRFNADAQVFVDLEGDVETEEYALDYFGFRTSKGDEAHLFATRTYEHPSEDFEIGGGVVEIPAGEYTFNAYGLRFLTHSSRPVSVEGSASTGDYFDGDRLSGSFTLRLRPSRFIRSETTWLHDDVDLPWGAFKVNIIRERLAIALSPRLLSNLLLQYDDLNEIVSLNFRFNWIYRPGADLFVVYNQTWDAPSLGDLAKRDRQFIVKFTYLFQK